jgi:2'-5' RNA ligase
LIYGILTILNESRNPELYQTWRELEASCQLPREFLTPVPHITWHVAGSYTLPELQEILARWTAHKRAITAQASGLGIFSGPSPVIYVRVFKDQRLINFQRSLWKAVIHSAEEPSAYYAPDAWMPHITLAYGEIPPDRLGCAIQALAYKVIRFKFTVDHVALGYLHEDNTWGIAVEYFLHSVQDRFLHYGQDRTLGKAEGH